MPTRRVECSIEVSDSNVGEGLGRAHRPRRYLCYCVCLWRAIFQSCVPGSIRHVQESDGGCPYAIRTAGLGGISYLGRAQVVNSSSDYRNSI